MKELSNYAVLSRTGPKHKLNQDNVMAYSEDGKNGFLLICDGVGGYPGGEVASRISGTIVYKSYVNKDPKISWSDWFTETIKMIKVELENEIIKNPDLVDMATTLCLAIIEDNHLYVFNIGDSMCYVYNRDGQKTMTTAQNLYNHLQRNGNLSAISLNANSKQLASLVNFVSARNPKRIWFDLTELDLKGDEVILVCSDGVYKFAKFTYFDLIGYNAIEISEKVISSAVLNDTNDDASVGVWCHGKA